MEETQEVEETGSTQEFNLDIGVKRQQFSNEKLLEDELTARIESGMPVFGMNLKIYKRKGEYGRQYIAGAYFCQIVMKPILFMRIDRRCSL